MDNIRDIINDDSRVFLNDDVPKEYVNNGNLKIFGVVFAHSEEEIIKLMKYADDNDLVVIVRGANTGVAGAQVPIIGNELIIDLKYMNKIIDLDEETLTLTLQPGVLLGDIHEYVEKRGYFYPPDPASKHSSIGGNVATNAGGLRAIKYGTTRDYIRSIRTVLIGGEVLELGSLNIKSSSGYDLLDLFIGSEGTLGVTSEIKLKLIPLNKYKSSILLAFDNVNAAVASTLNIIKSRADASEIELFEKDALVYAEEYLGYKLQSQLGNTYLLIEVDGNDIKDVNERINEIINVTKDLAVDTVLLDDKEEVIKAKRLRDNILIGLMEYTEYEMLDEVVPINKFADLIKYTKQLEEKYKLKVLNFGHAGDGNVHTVLLKENLEDNVYSERRSALLDDLYAKVSELGGLPSAEHGIGIAKRDYFLKMTSETNIKYMRKIKQVFDPKNLLNPNKVI